MDLNKRVEVINKFGQTLAIFSSEDQDNYEKLIDPHVTLTQNGENIFTFSIPENSKKWEEINNIENLYYVDGRVYSPLFEGGYQRVKTEDNKNLINVTCYERQKLLEKKFCRVWNSLAGLEEIQPFNVIILSKGNLPLTNENRNVDPGEYTLGSAGYILKGLLFDTGWEVGICDVEGFYDFETEQVDIYNNVLKVQTLFGGILIWDSVNQIVHLRDESNYVSYKGYEVRHKKNMKNFEETINNNLVTKLYPFGEAGLNIASVNDDKIYLEKYQYSNETFEAILNNTDIYEPEQLKRWAQRNLEDLCRPRKTITTNLAYLQQREEFKNEKIELNDSVDIVEDEVSMPLLPSDYQQLEYIEATGTQYIDTSYIANQDTSIEVDIEFTKIDNKASTLFCSRESLNTKTYTMFVLSTGFYRRDYGNTQYQLTQKPTVNTRYNILSKKNELYIDGVLVYTSPYTTFNSKYPLRLLASYNGVPSSTNKDNFARAIVRKYIIKDNEVEKHKFIPCYRKSDGKPGMYDVIGSEFYPNAGTGEFKIGPLVPDELSYERLRITGIDYNVYDPTTATITLDDSTKNTTDIFKKISNSVNAYVSGTIDSSLIKNYDTGNTVAQQFELQRKQNTTFYSNFDGILTSITELTEKVDSNGDRLGVVEQKSFDLDISTKGIEGNMQKQGGSNLLFDSSASFGGEHWRGVVDSYTDTTIQQTFLAKNCFRLVADEISQNIALPNGEYYIGFKYKKLIKLANCTFRVNDKVIDLTETDDFLDVEEYIEVTDHNITITISSDTNNACYIGDIMVCAGYKQKWSANSNEVYTDTVKIGEGIEISSNSSNTKFRADVDGTRIINVKTNEVIAEFTDKGTITNEFRSNKSEIAGVLHQQVGDQTWLSSLL